MIGLLVTTAFAGSSAQAATRTWNVTSGTGVWQTAGNWISGTAPANSTTQDTAAFSASNGSQTVQLNADASIAGLTFTQTGVTTLTSFNTTPRTLTIGTTGIAISGGAGAVTLGDATNPLNLAIAGNESWTNNSTSLFTVLGGVTGTAASGTSTLTVTGTGNSLLSGVIGNGGAGGTVAFTKNGAGTVTLSGNNTYSGTTTISAGVLRVTNNNALGSTGAGTTITSGAALELSNNVSIGAEALAIAGSGNSGGGSLVNVSGTNTYGGNITGNASTAPIYSNAGKLILSGSQLGSPVDARFAGSGDIEVTGNFAGLRSFTKFGGGALTLSGSNTMVASNGPIIYGGRVNINNSSSLSTTTWNIVAGTLDSNGNSFSAQSIALGTVVTNPGAFIQDNTTAAISTGAGTFTLGTSIVFGAAGSNYTPALVASGSAATISGNLDLGSVTHPWDIYGTTAANSALTVSANITGSASTSLFPIDRTKGIGTLVLSGSNSFTGQTRSQMGTLVLDYGTNNNSKLADASTFTLGGNGNAVLTLAGATGDHTEVVGSTSVTPGDVSINRSGANTAKINLGAISFTNSVLNIADNTLAQTSTAVANGILSRVFVNGTIATKSGSDIVANTTWTDVAGGGNIANGSTTNVRITSAGSSVGLSGSGTSTINTLTNAASSGGTTTVDIASGKTLTLAASSGIVNGPGATSLTISGSGTLAGTSNLLFVNNSANAMTISANINTTASVVKSGTGLLVLSGSNTGSSWNRSGSVSMDILGGTVRVDSALAIGGTSSIYMADRSAVLQYGTGITTDYSARLSSPNNNAPVSIDTNGNNVTFATRVNGLVQKYGSGTLTLTATGNNMVSVYAGTLSLGHASDTIGANAVEVLGGTLDVANPDTVGAVFLKSGAISGAATFIGTSYTLTDTGTISANLGSNSATLQKLGAGTAILSGLNAYTGITTVTQGVLRLNSANALPGGIASSGGLSNLTINGGVVGLGNGNFARSLGSGVTAVQILDAGGGFAAYGGDRTVNFGGSGAAVTWGSSSFMTSSNPGYLNGQGSFILGAADADGRVDFQNPIALTAAGVSATDWWVNTTTRTIRVNNGSAAVDGRLSGVISDGWSAMGINKTGLGTLEMTAVNTYTGPTTISAGRMLFSGSGSLSGTTGSVTVGGSGAELVWNSSNALTRALVMTQGTLSGTGTISAAGGVTIGGNVILSPGNSPGTLPFTTGLTLNPGGTYVWEVNSGTGSAGTNWDLINVTSGGLNLAALSNAAKFNLDLTTLTASGSSGSMDNYTPGGSYTWRIFDANALTLPGLFGSSPYAPGTDITSLFNLLTANWKNTVPAANDISVRVADNGTGIDLVVVPEPGTIALAGIGIAAAAYAYRRRRK